LGAKQGTLKLSLDNFRGIICAKLLAVPSLEPQPGRPLRYAIHASRKPWVTIHGHPLAACGEPMAGVRRVNNAPHPMRHIIAILLQNEAGALARVAGLFSTRGYNIESLSVAATDDPTVSRLTLVTKGSDAVIQQIANQLNKLVDVVNVEDMTLGEHLERELVLLKLKVRPERTDTVRGHVVRLGGRVLDPAADGFIVELTGSEAEVNTFVNELARDAELLEVVRSGALGIARNARPLRVVR
jgi:acetolactate synthase I/III small subunit